MPKKLLAIVALAAGVLAAVGCAGGSDLQGRVDELTREQEELQRQKEQTESELLAYKAKCEALEKGRSASRPAPAPAPAVTPVPGDLPDMDIRKRGNDTVINLPSDVLFPSGSATLNAAGERSMAKIVEFIRKHRTDGLIRVEGHSDCDPIRRTKSKFHCNWELSFERAHAVMHYLTERGQIDPHQLVCEAYGEYQPLSGKDKSKNRRVEIVIANR